MPLFAVERDLSQVPPERFRADLAGLVTACNRLQSAGKKVRYISSAVFPAEARGLCLFGAEEPQWVREVNDEARLPFSRIFAVLDLTPACAATSLVAARRCDRPPKLRDRGSRAPRWRRPVAKASATSWTVGPARGGGCSRW